MLQGERDLATVSNLIMSELAPLVNAQYGVFYVSKREEDETKLELVASYGAESQEQLKQEFELREGLIGQAAADRRPILLKDVPPRLHPHRLGPRPCASRPTSTSCPRCSRTKSRR